MVKLFTLFFSSLLCFALKAQTVETIISHPELRDGLHVDPAGNIYTSSGGFAGFEVGKYDIQAQTFEPNFATGFYGPVDVDQYQDSLLIVTNYDNNTVSSHNLNTGQNRIIADGLDGPSGIAIDAEENIFVASWGNAPNYAGQQIHRIRPNGTVTSYINSPLLYRPQAMTFGLDGALVINSNGTLYRVNAADSTLQQWINLGENTGHMVFRQADSCIYATASNRILKIAPDGSFSVFAGSSEGYQDGPLEDARFKGLLGIHFSPSEDTLYVCDSGYGGAMGRLRRIIMSMPVNTDQAAERADILVFPNPAKQHFSIVTNDHLSTSLEMIDQLGRVVFTKKDFEYTVKIDASIFPSGLYTIRINHPTGIQLKTLSIQH